MQDTVQTVQPLTPQTDRITTLDAIRGYALFIVLLVNVYFASQPLTYTIFPGFINDFNSAEGINWAVIMTFFNGAGRALFGLLFGAGMMLILDRLQESFSAGKARRIYFTRIILLAGLGLFDLFILLWWGDILLLYALCGVFLYFIRGWSTKTLSVIAVLMLVYLTLMSMGQGFGLTYKYPVFQEVLALSQAGKDLTAGQQALLNDLAFLLDPAVVNAETAIIQTGSFADIRQHFIRMGIEMNIASFHTTFFWDSMLAMILGLRLYRSGYLLGQAETKTYTRNFILLFGFAILLRAVGYVPHVLQDFDGYWGGLGSMVEQITRLMLAVAAISFFHMLAKKNTLTFLITILAPFGRMALTNYLTQSVMLLLVFSNIGLGLYDKTAPLELWGLVFAVLVLQLAFSTLWLSTFRFGPVEWIWRQLTYVKYMPLKR